MSERIRFHLDENVDPVVALALRRYGIDVTTTVEAGLRTANDEQQFAYAQRENRVIITLRLARKHPENSGIAYCHKEARSIGEMIRELRLIYEVLTPKEMEGHKAT